MYPILKTNEADHVAFVLANVKNSGPVPSDFNKSNFLQLDAQVTQRAGADVSEAELYATAEAIQRVVKEITYKDKYHLEELYAEYLHESLRDIPRIALQDPDFWRYLALFPFRSYLVFREPSLEWQSYGGKSGTKKTHWLLPRTFLWGRKCWDAETDDYSLVHAIRESRISNGLSTGTIIDFYHSHIVRLNWSSSTPAASGFIEGFIADPVIHDKDNSAHRPSQVLSAKLGRIGNNVCLPFIGADKVSELVIAEKIKISAD